MKASLPSRSRISAALLASVLALLPLVVGFQLPGTVSRLWRKADRAVRDKQYQQAADLYGQALEAHPQEWALRYNRGVAQAMAKSLDKAVDDLQQVAKDGPQQLREPAEYNTGNCYLAQGEADKAVEHYKRALYLNPNDVNAKWNLELAKRKQQQQQKQQQQEKQRQKQDKQKQQQQQNKQKQQQQQGKMDQNEAQRLLRSLSQEDRDLQKKLARQLRAGPTQETRPAKDW